MAIVAACNLGHYRARNQAIQHDLGLEIVRPAPPAAARENLDPSRGRLSYVVRSVVHCEHCPIEETVLPDRQCRRLGDQKGGGAPLTLETRLDQDCDEVLGETAKTFGRYLSTIGVGQAPDTALLGDHIDSLHALTLEPTLTGDQRIALLVGLQSGVDAKLAAAAALSSVDGPGDARGKLG